MILQFPYFAFATIKHPAQVNSCSNKHPFDSHSSVEKFGGPSEIPGILFVCLQISTI